MFCDEVTIKVIAGKGGDGLVSFRHQKFVPKGGPDGGDGGKGGDIYLEVDDSINTLSLFNRYKTFQAEAGEGGKQECRHGKSGEDLILPIPLGTMIFDAETNELFWDTAELKNGTRLLLARGGKGGYGNAHYKTATQQTPKVAQLGLPGEVKKIKLELKLIADVGLIGFPNVGKSTLISAISNARPKIANYEFTTLLPNLGTVNYKGKSFVVADIPGLIEGASKGKGLGYDFLKHVERTRLLVHLIDAQSGDFEKDFQVIRKELEKFNPTLTQYPYLLVINKIDLVEKENLDQKVKKFKSKGRDKVYLISAASKKGTGDLLDEIILQLSKLKRRCLVKPIREKEYKVFRPAEEIDFSYQVKRKNEYFIVEGKKVAEVVLQTNLDNPFAVEDMYFKLKKLGVLRKLEKIGVKEGDKVKVAGKVFYYQKNLPSYGFHK